VANNNLHPAPRVHGATLALTQCTLWLLAACGSDEGMAGTASAQEALPDPCALVTGADAEHVLGAPGKADRPKEANNQYVATCRYVAPRGEGVAVMTIMVHGPEAGRAGFRSLKEQPFESEDVVGVGDEAFLMGETLYVLHEEVFFSIGGDLALEQAKALAMKAIDRLR
jgi:hypothetical protein